MKTGASFAIVVEYCCVDLDRRGAITSLTSRYSEVRAATVSRTSSKSPCQVLPKTCVLRGRDSHALRLSSREAGIRRHSRRRARRSRAMASRDAAEDLPTSPNEAAGRVSGWVFGTISATGCSWAHRPAKGHENRRVCRMAVLGAARSRLAMEQARPSNCLIRSVRD